MLSTSLSCALCGKPLDRSVRELQKHLQSRVLDALHSSYPDWRPEDGVCPTCVSEQVRRAVGGRSARSLHDELLLPYPVYSPDELGILPIATRLHANPQFSGEGVTMAFLDSGFYPHPDLIRPADRILCYVDATGTEPVEKEHFKKPSASSWHGLMTSAVAAGSGFMSDGLYRGLANRANLVLVKTGNRRGRRIHDADIARALNWVIANQHRHNIQVINISLGGDQPTDGQPSRLDALVEEAVCRGMVVVAAIGNGGRPQVIPPASAVSAISVGGLDDRNALDPFFHRMYSSNFGTGVDHVPKPEVIAPAAWLAAPMLPKTWVHNQALYLFRLETMPDQDLARMLKTEPAQSRFSRETLRQPLGEIRRAIRCRMIEQKYIHPHYQHVDGTSFAAPIVSSVVAQMLEANPSLSPTRIKALLLETARRLEAVPAERQGFGAVHAGRAVAAALRESGGGLAGLPFSPHIAARKVTFHYYNGQAKRVGLVGTFNHWQPRGYELGKESPGAWTLTIPQPPSGVHAYKFLVDETHWVDDPENPAWIEDGYGGFHSLFAIGE